MRQHTIDILLMVKTESGIVKQVKAPFILTADENGNMVSYKCVIPPINENYVIYWLMTGYVGGVYTDFVDWLQSLNISGYDDLISLSWDANLTPVEKLCYGNDFYRIAFPLLHLDNALYRDGNVSHDLIPSYEYIPLPAYRFGVYDPNTDTVVKDYTLMGTLVPFKLKSLPPHNTPELDSPQYEFDGIVSGHTGTLQRVTNGDVDWDTFSFVFDPHQGGNGELSAVLRFQNGYYQTFEELTIRQIF